MVQLGDSKPVFLLSPSFPSLLSQVPVCNMNPFVNEHSYGFWKHDNMTKHGKSRDYRRFIFESYSVHLAPQACLFYFQVLRPIGYCPVLSCPHPPFLTSNSILESFRARALILYLRTERTLIDSSEHKWESASKTVSNEWEILSLNYSLLCTFVKILNGSRAKC